MAPLPWMPSSVVKETDDWGFASTVSSGLASLKESASGLMQPIGQQLASLMPQQAPAPAGPEAPAVSPFQLPDMTSWGIDLSPRPQQPQQPVSIDRGPQTGPRASTGPGGAPGPTAGGFSLPGPEAWGMEGPSAPSAGAGQRRPAPAAGQAAPSGEIDNSSRQAFIKSAYPYALDAADGDPVLANQLVATAISENGKVGTGRSLGEMGFNVGGIQGVKGPAGSFMASDAGNMREFAAYNTLSEGFRAVRDLVSGGARYQPAAATYRQTGDVDRYWQQVNQAGYAEDPNWHAKVGSIRRNQVEPLTKGLPAAPAGTQGPPTAGEPGGPPLAPGPVLGAPSGSLDVSGITKAYAGVPYTFGGPGGRGQGLGATTDCSGFVSAVWKSQYGLDLPAHTDAAYNALKQQGAVELSQADARPGDVVFYMGAGTGGAITHHVGIYAEPGKVLDMSTGGGSGVKLRDVGHGGQFVILRDPRLSAETPKSAAPPQPIVQTGVAERTGGQKLPQAQVDALSNRPTAGEAGGPELAPGPVWMPPQAQEAAPFQDDVYREAAAPAPNIHANVARAFEAANGRPPTPEEAAELASLGFA